MICWWHSFSYFRWTPPDHPHTKIVSLRYIHNTYLLDVVVLHTKFGATLYGSGFGKQFKRIDSVSVMEKVLLVFYA